MRHRVAGKKLGRKTAHRLMMFRNMVTSLLDKERIQTTVERAKALRPVAEKIITLGKRDTLHARRQALAFVNDPAMVAKLFTTLAPRFATRPGGYTRIIKLGERFGDAAEIVILELVDFKLNTDAATDKKAKKEAKKEGKKEKAAAKEEKK